MTSNVGKFILPRFMKPCRLWNNNEANVCPNVVDMGLYIGLTNALNCGEGGSVIICSVGDRACRRPGLLNVSNGNN
jgi:hypothetical protein